MTPATGTRPVQLKIAVDDIDEAIAFYQQAFGFHYDITRRTDEGRLLLVHLQQVRRAGLLPAPST